MAYLIDTCVFIDYLTERLPETSAKWLEEMVISGMACTSVIVYHELLTGASTDKARKIIEDLIASLEVIPVDQNVAAEAASTRRNWRKEGKTLSMADTLIGATAKLQGCAVLTCNIKDFPAVLTIDPYSVPSGE
ncbi:MAG: type II toxin-antitoxin system VapC family toxin [Bacillota bacterium]